ncbi:MAG: CDP-alcohol phosphatidyltransferase family protein [Candidatus Omnitrophota bacterium]
MALTYSEVRHKIYERHMGSYPDVFKWGLSYRRLKRNFYSECASVIVFTLLKTPISPNTVTVVYIALSVCAGILLALPPVICVLVAVVLLFLKPTLDWADGSLAHMKNKKSAGGDILDYYSASVDWITLWAGLGIYLGNTTSPIFFYLAPVIPTVFALDIYKSAQERFIYAFARSRSTNTGEGKTERTNDKLEKPGARKIKDWIDKVLFAHNTCVVDGICLFILIEAFFTIRVLWIYYCMFLVWMCVTFLLRLYLALFKNRLDYECENLQRKLYG